MRQNSDPVLMLRDCGKSYRLYHRPHDRLKQGFWPGRRYVREFWALRGVTFSVGRGETVGIVGRNGSGKSTLLQLVAGTLEPTTGAVRARGRVTALLELGTGFNPDFTGRENVFLNGAILGLSRAQMGEYFQEILDFAEIGDFVDQPVRAYSSGMLARLAFAVQVVVPKEILVVDEIITVGDEAFQRKCFARIERFTEEGGTVLLVSHDAGLIIQLCDRAILLDRGELLLEGESKKVVHLYQRLLYAPPSAQEELRQDIRNLGALEGNPRELPVSSLGDAVQSGEMSGAPLQQRKSVERRGMNDPNLVSKSPVRYESKGARIEDPRLTMTDGGPVNLLRSGELYVWRYRVVFDRRFTNVRFGMMIKTLSGIDVGGRTTAALGNGVSVIEPGTRWEVIFRFRANLVPGTYFLNAGVVALLPEGETYIDRWVEAVIFKVLPEGEPLVTGVVDFGIEVQLLLEGHPVPTKGEARLPAIDASL